MNHESTTQIHNPKSNVNKFVRGLNCKSILIKLQVNFDLSTFEVMFTVLRFYRSSPTRDCL